MKRNIRQEGPGQALHSEDDILSCINSFFPTQHHSMPLGRGDDCAVLKTPQRICVSTDLFLEDIHFRQSYFTPEEIGHKALAVNISDIAAMGAKPLAFSMGLMLPKNMRRASLEGMMRGMAELAKKHDIALSGGDISRAASLGFSITIYGEAQDSMPNKQGHFLQRGVCQEGDIIFLIGDVGLARVGLLSLESMGRRACELYPTACRAHLMPQPLIEMGLMLAEYAHLGERLGLMDLSDGLARDLSRLLGHSMGADIVFDSKDLHADIIAFAKHEVEQGHEHMNHEDVLQRAVHHTFMGGEDYALLGTCSPTLFEKIQERWAKNIKPNYQVRSIGTVKHGHITLNGHIVHESGFDHFGAQA